MLVQCDNSLEDAVCLFCNWECCMSAITLLSVTVIHSEAIAAVWFAETAEMAAVTSEQMRNKICHEPRELNISLKTVNLAAMTHVGNRINSKSLQQWTSPCCAIGSVSQYSDFNIFSYTACSGSSSPSHTSLFCGSQQPHF